MSNYVCSICGFIYSEDAGYPEGDISPGTLWDDIPSDFVCPLCGASKSEFNKEEESDAPAASVSNSTLDLPGEIRYSSMQLSAIFSNLAKGCEKQYNQEMAELYWQMSSYYDVKKDEDAKADWQSMQSLLESDITEGYEMAGKVAESDRDRGTLRALKWTGGVSRIVKSHLGKLKNGNTAFFEDKNVYVCESCGFLFVGDEKPEVCPVCKVPNRKLSQIKRGA